MDTWIPRKIATSEGGAYVDNETGELLSQEKTADYERFRSLPNGGTSRPLGTHSGPVHAEGRR